MKPEDEIELVLAMTVYMRYVAKDYFGLPRYASYPKTGEGFYAHLHRCIINMHADDKSMRWWAHIDFNLTHKRFYVFTHSVIPENKYAATVRVLLGICTRQSNNNDTDIDY